MSDYLELDAGMSISAGRGDERSSADANRLTLTLDNRDGRFTPGRVTSPYYPNVKLDRPIRVTATPVDGAASVRFLGFISEWPVEWEGSDGYARVTISASSRLARLGLTTALKSIVEETFLADSPVAYYTLGEPVGSAQANDSSGRAAAPLAVSGDPAAPVVFGNAIGPGTDGLTAVQFSGGQGLRGGGPFVSGSTWSCDFFFAAPPGPGLPDIVTAYDGAGVKRLQVGVNGQVSVGINANPTADITTASSYADGNIHHVGITQSGTTLRLYIDGVSQGTATVAALGAPIAVAVVGQTYGGAPSASPLTAGHLAFYTSTLTPTQIAAHAAAGLTGFLGESTDARLKRYAALTGVPAAEVYAEAGQTTTAHIDITGKQAVEMMRLVETTEGGVLYDRRDGVLTMHNRAHRYTAASAYTLDMTQHMVESGYSPKLDRSTLLNDVTASNVDGTVTARKTDTTSRADNGNAVGSVETASADKDQPNDLASWMVYKYSDPKARVSELSVDALAQVNKTPNCAAVMETDVSTKVTIAGHPQQAAYSSVDYFVEGYTEVYGPESLRFTFNVSPTSPDDRVLVVDDPARGVVDTYPVAF